MTQDHPIWSASVLTLFPEMFPGPLGHSLAGRALERGIWSLDCYQIRDFAIGRHKDVDGPACGGGVGLVMRADVMGAAIDHVLAQHDERPVLLYPSPRGKTVSQPFLRELAEQRSALFVCGRYEGLDQRVIDHYQLVEISVGDYVLSGGELAALTIMDGVVRLLDGVMGKPEGHLSDSFENGLLEHSQYTLPRQWKQMDVPEILLSGHHQQIAEYKFQQSCDITQTRRPDLWHAYEANKQANKQAKNDDKY